MRLKLALLWLRLRDWFNYEQCHKESMGYTCHHRVMSNGNKECN